MDREAAIALYDSNWWETVPDEDIVKFQLFEERLCLPFDRFCEALEKVLKRPVFTHEFAHIENLQKELLGDRPAPTFEEILNLIPADKRILLVVH